jgi:hypothetical protein
VARRHPNTIRGEDAKEEALLRELAEDKTASPAVRMRALEVLERKRARQAGEAAQREAPDELAPDPMADLDEMEAARQRRARRGGTRKVAAR